MSSLRCGATRTAASIAALILLWSVAPALRPAFAAARDQAALVTLSIVGTSDLHGVAFPKTGSVGGLSLLAGYVNNLRAVRAAGGGAVLLLDSGDTFQGEVESNLSEGAVIVDAYNAMGYAAEAIGNHDFDFGSIDSPAARQLPGDPRGALKARAAQARYPFLAANLIDEATGTAVAWPNVRPSVLQEVAGIKVGVIGVMTIDALRSTLAANVQGLRIAPLAPTIAAEATALRAAGAEVVIVAAHAGGRCERFDRPEDLSSCDADAEIFRVAESLPPRSVDVIASGHTHGGVAHRVNGIAIIQAFARGQSFGRVDIAFDRRTRRVARVQPFAPREIVPADYEGKLVASDPTIIEAMAAALQRVRQIQATPIGLSMDHPVPRVGNVGSPLGNVFAEALRDAVPGADVGAVNNAGRGLWADLPSGPVTFGRLYAAFPFDNRIAQIALTGAQLSEWVAGEIRLGRRDGLGLSGIAAQATCAADGLHVDLFRGTKPIHGNERLLAVTIGGPTLSGSLASSAPVAGVGPVGSAPVVRELVEDWLRRLGPAGQRRVDEVTSSAAPIADPPFLNCIVR